MPSQSIPDEPPPPYDAASAPSSSRPTGSTNTTTGRSDNNHLGVPGASSRNHAIPADRRRSMEDEMRPLPKGWVRTYDPESAHHFYVDITKEPPRSIWVHPYDDDQYLSTLSTEERERVEQESLGRGRPPSKADILAEHTDEEEDHASASSSSIAAQHGAELPPRPEGKKSFGRKLKDKMTGMTHEEREVERKKRAEQEKKAYEQHQRMRAAMAKAAQTGEPQLVGKDRAGKDVYVEPPSYAGGMGGYGGGGYGYNPYSSGGMYASPNSRYARPAYPYSRPYGGGFGGGYGMPLALGGGLLGGMMIGDMMGGGMGGGFGGGGF